MLRQEIKGWNDPLEIAYQISIDKNYKENWAFFYSGLHKTVKNSKSFLCLFPKKEIVANDFLELEKALKISDGRWFGYFGYDLKNVLEKLPKDKNSFINLPNLWMINFGLILEFDHDEKRVFEYVDTSYGPRNECGVTFLDEHSHIHVTPHSLRGPYDVSNLTSNFTKKQYLQKVKTIQNKIKNGEFYQANLTRKFFGKFKNKNLNHFEIFLKLNRISPANYSSFLKLGKNFIISSSPELFLKIDKNNNVLSSPIKGTAPRFKNLKLDKISKQNLQNSEKEKGENLMIVDLVRNDLSRTCLPNSVNVKNLFQISSYKTVHHMSSDILGIKNPKFSNLDVVKSCFPPGSMTGAPKIKAMEICSELEKNKRGIYSGTIGFIDDRECELSVVIRTLIIEGNKFEFQVGGAITFDSIPQKEWQETINKAKGIAKTLGIKINKLKKI